MSLTEADARCASTAQPAPRQPQAVTCGAGGIVVPPLLAAKMAARKELLAVRNALLASQVARDSAAVARTVLALPEFQHATHVMGFLSFGSEISVDAILKEALRLGKTVAVPRINGPHTMVAAQLTRMTDLPRDRYGIRTPDADAPVVELPPDTLILVPGVGFTLTGVRLGMGAGFYDRFLSQVTGYRLGITCHAQLREALPADEHDECVQAMVTETGLIRC